MKALTFFSTVCAFLAVSCAELAVMTAPTGTKTLPRSQWGEFERLREFVTLQPLALYPSTKGLVHMGERQSPGADGKLENQILIPRRSCITVTRIVLTKCVGPDWNLKQGRIIYGTLEMDGEALRDIHLSVIANFDDEPSYDRQIVSPL